MTGQGGSLIWFTHLAGLIGAALLAYPVLRLDQLGARLNRLERLAPDMMDDQRWARLYERVRSELGRRRQSWTPLTRYCLWLGYALLLGSQAVRLWLPG